MLSKAEMMSVKKRKNNYSLTKLFFIFDQSFHADNDYLLYNAAYFTEQCKNEDEHPNNSTREPFQTSHSFPGHLLILNDWYFSAGIPWLPIKKKS